ncbi:uncharacterized protein [Montipora capricornis]|uniref:uncharacterized protein isoform X1 n=1 Tax=Montipora capricornis TaxID=246305 RepID=UPI0035F1A4CF
MIVCCSLQIYFQVVSLAMAVSFVSGDCIDWDLGMENGLIPNERITASGAFSHDPASSGRLNDVRGSWCAPGDNQYLQIDLQSLHVICAVSTQGNGIYLDWVKKYTLQSSTDNKRWTDYKENGLVKIFDGNNDANTAKKNVLSNVLITRWLRFVVKDYNVEACMRTEVYGVKQKPETATTQPGSSAPLIIENLTAETATTQPGSSSPLIIENLTAVLVPGVAAVAVSLIVGAAIILYRRRKMQLQNFKYPVDADKLQSNCIFDQHSNYCSNPNLLNYEVPRNRMEFIEELEQENALLFEYDAFIIYSSIDEEWVRGTLLPTLEDKHGFKCCIHYRDFMPGVLYRENMVNSVYASKKTVAVVSKNFFNSGFCESEFEYALLRLAERRDDSLIVIKLDDIDTRKLPLEVRKRSYIDCPKSIEKETWETKLVKSLNSKTR